MTTSSKASGTSTSSPRTAFRSASARCRIPAKWAAITSLRTPTSGSPAVQCPYSKNVLIGLASSLTAANTNVVLNNDVGVFAFNADAAGNAPLVVTQVIIAANIASDDRCFNPYQAGISDLGNSDII